MNWYRGIKHEIRLKSQFVALQAKNPRSLVVDDNGYLNQSNKEVNPFSDGITSFQVRYKYEIAPLSYIYLVYTKGGRVFEDNVTSCLLYTSPSPRDRQKSRMPSSA